MAAILFLLSALLTLNLVSAANLYLYEHKNHKGARWTVDPYRGDCVNLPNGDAASSVNTHGDCFILYEHNGCSGRALAVGPGRGCHYNLADCRFNDITSSVRRC